MCESKSFQDTNTGLNKQGFYYRIIFERYEQGGWEDWESHQTRKHRWPMSRREEGKLGGSGLDSLMSKEGSERLSESLNQNWPTDGFADTKCGFASVYLLHSVTSREHIVGRAALASTWWSVQSTTAGVFAQLSSLWLEVCKAHSQSHHIQDLSVHNKHGLHK